ncbi:Indole-3-acetaldehyde oxidase [Capsicum chinense]|nr:Indole-3-acetaldehyde oxidase [Capsicum chinense]
MLNIHVLYEALELVKLAVVPEAGTLHPEYRSSLAVSYVFEFLYPFTGAHSAISGRLLNGNNDISVEEVSKSSEDGCISPGRKQTLLSSAKQIVESSTEYYPVGEAMQAAGEAVYVDDIPSPPNCLHGAFIYSTKPLADSPILTVEDAVEKSSFIQIPPLLYPKQVGDFSKGMAEADRKILSAEMKTTAWLFILQSSPENAQRVISTCLGVPEHNIRVIARRVGGGFGGKAVRAMPVSTACALAAYKLRRPVRIYVNWNSDMIMTGGRHPMNVTYSVGFKSSGKITALHLDLLINAGISDDISPIVPLNVIKALKKYD